ncbi:MAG: palmitoyltransferase for Vac8p [Pycnora praestabilis]|nr:MAG: palmitoyltransferase for Vac8p [Pycnora praestabilis]
MALLESPSPSQSPPLRRRRRGWARKCERYCCATITYFPLAFIYGLTTWAIWIEANIGFLPSADAWTGYTTSVIGIALYVLLNWSYTTAVFTDPGSPLSSNNGYSHLPTQESQNPTSFTVKSTGGSRFCKKCQAKKPDRAHHCSTCQRCVLKMDHHCPWLATCVGLRNYKAFLLFLMYTSLFCWICFAVSMTWVWNEMLVEDQYTDSLMPVNYVLLVVIAGIIGLVLTGFTGWHLSLAWRGQTTIECLEKTRYLSPLRRSMQQNQYQQNYVNGDNPPSYGQQLREIHTNTLPGVTRPEEGEEGASPAPHPRPRRWNDPELGQRTYNDVEQSRERERYEEYLDEQDSEKLPNAFDLGWRRNLEHLFGDKPALWLLPICNTSGNGWQWEPSPKWIVAREEVRREREDEQRAQQQRERNAGWGVGTNTPQNAYIGYSDQDYTQQPENQRQYLATSEGLQSVPTPARRSPGKADQVLGRSPNQYFDGSLSSDTGVSMKTLRSPRQDEDEDEDEDADRYDMSSDEEAAEQRRHDQWWGRKDGIEDSGQQATRKDR